MQQQGSKAKTPPKKGAQFFFFFRKPLFLTNFFSKTLVLHHPLKTVHQKISQKSYFYRLKKDGQVIDPTMARLSTLLWPKYGQVIDPTAHIYIYVCIYIYAAGCLIEPPLFTLCARNLRKRSAKMIFFIKISFPKSVRRGGSIKHP